jgi:hypothetical protein|tara:strand:- start:11212 stop:11460 length:249 start_codon:yes stop_codon:yes gene_type:complete
MTEKINPTEIVEVTSLFDRDLEELAEDKESLDKIVTYLREQRVNVRSAESTGKRITKKVATGDTSTAKKNEVPPSAMDVLND